MVRVGGLALAVGYAAAIIWLYASQPQTRAEAIGGLAATVGAYRVEPRAFEDGLRFFHADKFVEARFAFDRADPARRDAVTQFYIAYSFYRQGWGRFYRDDRLYRQGLEAVNRAIEVAPGNRVVVDDDQLGLQTADELKAELERGLTRELSGFNPLRVLERRR